MGWWPFGRRSTDDKSVETLLAEANTPTGDAGAAAAAPALEGDLRLVVDDVFFIQGRGAVVTGKVESGVARVGQHVDVVRDGGVAFSTEITGIEMFRKVLDTAHPGDNVGLLLRGLGREQLHSGDVVQG